MKRIFSILLSCMLLFLISACGNSETGNFKPSENSITTESDITDELSSSLSENKDKEDAGMKLNVQVGSQTFTATLENNTTTAAFVGMLKKEPIIIKMSDYSGFEKVGSIGQNLPTDNRQTTTQSGDIVLYNGNQIVIFYGANSWSYTRLGKIDNLSGWEEALGSGDVTVTFSI